MATNPLFNVLNGWQQPANNGFPNFMADFQRLQQTVKNPRQEVERLLHSGLSGRTARKQSVRTVGAVLLRHSRGYPG